MRARGAVAFGAALIAMLCAGLWLGGHPIHLPGPLRNAFVAEPAGLTAEAGELIRDNYYRPVGEEQLANASLQGLVRELRKSNGDRFSEYFSAEHLAAFNAAIEGHFSGIGLSVIPVKRGLRVVQVFRGSPADRAGVLPGEEIVSVDGKSIAGLNSEIATAKIKGPEGTEVRVGVRRPRGGEVRPLRLTRAQVDLPNVASHIVELDGHKLGYLRLATFSRGASLQLASAARKLRREGAEGIVLDLRSNGGGLLGEAVSSASVFMPEGKVVVSTESRTQGRSVYKAVGGNLPPLPLVVLIDRNTASAAEILAAALAERAGATIVGSRSFGKGVFQQELPLANGGALKLTIGEYFTPDGKNLAGKGIHPDVRAGDDPSTRRVDEGKARGLRVLAGRIEA